MFILLFFFLISISAFDNNNTLKINIYEELPSNTLLYSSISLSKNLLQWLPSSYIYQSYFSLNINQSLYTTNQRIDREEFCKKKFCNCSQCLINLNFLQTFSINNISIRTIQIIIQDINDHSPIFKQSILKLSIAENVPINYEIPLESAIDDDYGLYSIKTYELYPINNNPFYLIKKPNLILKLNQILDREIQTNYFLKLIAYDGGQPSLSGEQIIEIIITDVNDNPPIFEQLIYQKILPENQPINSMIIKIHANDQDENENGQISYSIDDSSLTFSIHHQTGEIYLKKSLDYEKLRFYSLTIKANDHGMPQLTNYVTLIINVTDVNDHTPTIFLTDVNGTIMTNHILNLSECSLIKNIPLLYIYITDEDSGDNGRVHCQLNDTRLNLISLTINVYSLQTNNLSLFDYEYEQLVIIHLQCQDFGLISLTTSTLFYLQIQDCNDNPPDIIYPLPFHQPLRITYETIQIPFIITQFIIDDKDCFQSKNFSYSFIVSPPLDISLSNNGILILHSMPIIIGLFTINITVYDIGNLTNSIIIPIDIQSKNTNIIVFFTLFLIIFLAAILISICFLIAFICRKNLQKNSRENSSSQSITSSNEQVNTSQKTIMEIIDQGTNSSNRIYQYGVKQAGDMKVINTIGKDQSHFNYSEKVERYLTHLNNHGNSREIDEGVYGSSDISFDHIQQLNIRPESITSQSYQDSLKRFEHLYSLVEHHQQKNSSFTSDSLYA